MKKLGGLILAVLCLFSCGQGDNNSSQPFNSDLIYKAGLLYNQRRFQVELPDTTYYIDGKSFHNEKSGETIFKYVFSDGYCSYKGNELLDDQCTIELDVAEEFIRLLNPNYFQKQYFSIQENHYTLLDSSEEQYQTPFIDEEIKGLEISLIDNGICYSYQLENGKYDIKFFDSERRICAYLQTPENYENYYENYKIGYDEYLDKKKTGEDFGVILFSPTCASCEFAQGTYYEFFIEYHMSFFYCVNFDLLSREQKNEWIKPIQSAYLSQSEEFRLKGYDEYPSGYLLPTALKVSKNEVKGVMPGFSASLGALFCDFCKL